MKTKELMQLKENDMSKHTPGPWKMEFIPKDKYPPVVIQIRSQSGKFVAELERESDGTIIAAAPDMLQALKEAMVVIKSQNKGSCLMSILEAIEKAEGLTKNPLVD